MFVFVCVVHTTVLVVIVASVWSSVELSVKPLLECDDDSTVAVAGAVLHAMQVMSLMLT